MKKEHIWKSFTVIMVTIVIHLWGCILAKQCFEVNANTRMLTLSLRQLTFWCYSKQVFSSIINTQQILACQPTTLRLWRWSIYLLKSMEQKVLHNIVKIVKLLSRHFNSKSQVSALRHPKSWDYHCLYYILCQFMTSVRIFNWINKNVDMLAAQVLVYMM